MPTDHIFYSINWKNIVHHGKINAFVVHFVPKMLKHFIISGLPINIVEM